MAPNFIKFLNSVSCTIYIIETTDFFCNLFFQILVFGCSEFLDLPFFLASYLHHVLLILCFLSFFCWHLLMSLNEVIPDWDSSFNLEEWVWRYSTFPISKKGFFRQCSRRLPSRNMATKISMLGIIDSKSSITSQPGMQTLQLRAWFFQNVKVFLYKSWFVQTIFKFRGLGPNKDLWRNFKKNLAEIAFSKIIIP